MPTVGFENSDIFLEPRSHAYVQGTAHAKERAKNVLISHLWVPLRVFKIRKLRQCCKLLEAWKAFHSTHRDPLGKAGRFIGSKPLRKPVLSIANWTENSVVTCDKEYNLIELVQLSHYIYKIKPPSTTITSITMNSEEVCVCVGGGLQYDFQGCHIILFYMFRF